jgi:LPS O-antigen subunit length determinant protein (WzzB/FepE family)
MLVTVKTGGGDDAFQDGMPASVKELRKSHSSKREKAKDVAKNAWEAVKAALQVAKDATNGVPIVQQVLGGLVAIIDKIDVCPLSAASWLDLTIFSGYY